ncbi:MAG: DUF2283 domain-containing protein [Nitrospirae bacterium]|nr:DUF2283 domain-containing protein [Nitrospirota bacterium]
MKITYDPRYNIAYLRLQKKVTEVETIKISDEINIDIAPDGTIYGIELLNANEQIGKEDKGNLLVVNEATGEETEIVLAGRVRARSEISEPCGLSFCPPAALRKGLCTS